MSLILLEQPFQILRQTISKDSLVKSVTSEWEIQLTVDMAAQI